jgi:hypothetical protein
MKNVLLAEIQGKGEVIISSWKLNVENGVELYVEIRQCLQFESSFYMNQFFI